MAGEDSDPGTDAERVVNEGEDTPEQPAEATAPEEPTPVDSASAATSQAGRRFVWLRVGRALLAPLLAAGAVGVHFALNVPDEIPVSKRDQGAKTRGRSRSRPTQPRREDPRDEAELAKQWKQYGGTDFDREPVRVRWSRATQPLVNKAVVVARKRAFEGAPEEPRVIVTQTRCKTIRCRFVLRSPFQHEVQLLARTMEDLQTDGQPLWRSFETRTIEPPSDAAPDEEHYLEVTVAFTADDIDSRTIVAPEEPDEAEADDAASGSDDEPDTVPE